MAPPGAAGFSIAIFFVLIAFLDDVSFTRVTEHVHP